MDLIFKPLEEKDMPYVLSERNKCPETLRTVFPLNLNQQMDYFKNVLSNRQSTTRYLIGYDNEKVICYGGIENIQWENSIGEISLIVFTPYKGKGYGTQAVSYFIDNLAFDTLNLKTVWGECYECGNTGFWDKIIKQRAGYSTTLPYRKYYNGKFYNSLYFSFTNKGER